MAKVSVYFNYVSLEKLHTFFMDFFTIFHFLFFLTIPYGFNYLDPTNFALHYIN